MIEVVVVDNSSLEPRATYYQSLIRNMNHGFVVLGVIRNEKGEPIDCQYLEANPAFEKITGLGDVVGKTVREGLPSISQDWFNMCGQVAETGVPEHFEMFAVTLNRHYDTALYSPGKKLVAVVMFDITERKQLENALDIEKEESEKLIEKLKVSMENVKALSGLLPICAHCKHIRDDEGYWHQVEVYIRDRTEAEFSHGICPKCMKELYPDVDQDDKQPDPPA
jgi:hypothetical protein